MPTMDDTEQFVATLTASQSRIYAYILTLLPHPSEAADVLQETNIVLWREANKGVRVDDFVAWSCKIAYYQALAYLRDCKRDRHRFDPALLAEIADQASIHAGALDDRLIALRDCLSKLSDDDRKMVLARYTRHGNVKKMAKACDKSPNALSRRLYRIRKSLLACIERHLRTESVS